MIKKVFKILFSKITITISLLLVQVVLLLMFANYLRGFIPILFGSAQVFTMITIIIILNSKDNPMIKLSWITIVSLLPILGVTLYCFFNFNLGYRFYRKKINTSIINSFKYSKNNISSLDVDKETKNLANYLYSNGGYNLFENTKVTYYPLGENKWEAMKHELTKAKHFIFLEYFIIEEGKMWNEILEILKNKAQEGVEVRVMYDGTCAFSTLSFDYDKFLNNLGIKCKVFAPIKPFMSTHYNNRDHRKILVIDNMVAFNGGVNLADEYINHKKVLGHWKDTAIKLEGEACSNLTLMFLQMWNDEKEDYFKYLNKYSVQNDGYVISYGDNPYDEQKIGEMVYLDILNTAKDYVYIMSPYLIIDNEMITSLKFAAARGIDVRIILPHIPDKKFVHIQARSHYQELIDAGVKIYEYTPGFVHGKMFVSDDIKAVVGTINLDYRSLYLHFECASYLYKNSAIIDIKKDFEACFKKSELININSLNKDKIVNKILGKVLKMISPLM